MDLVSCGTLASFDGDPGIGTVSLSHHKLGLFFLGFVSIIKMGSPYLPQVGRVAQKDFFSDGICGIITENSIIILFVFENIGYCIYSIVKLVSH